MAVVSTSAVMMSTARASTVAEEPPKPSGESAAESGSSAVVDRLPGCKLKLSCAAYSFRSELSGAKPTMTLEGFIDFCTREGLEATELTSYYFQQTDRDYLLSLRRRACVNGLAISGTPIRNDFCLPPGPERDRWIAHTKEWIERAAILGSQSIRIFAGNVPKGGNEAEARDRAIEGFREVASYAGKHGILLALENHGGITSTAEQLLALVRGVDSPWFGINLDTGNFHTRVYESLEKVAPYAVAVQVKVEVREGKEPARPADFGRIVGILRRSGYRGYVALEYEAKEAAAAAVPRHLRALRAAMEAG